MEKLTADRRQVERQLDKLIHEINNSLTSIVAQAELGTYHEDQEAKNEAFRQIGESSLECADLARQMRSYLSYHQHPRKDQNTRKNEPQ